MFLVIVFSLLCRNKSQHLGKMVFFNYVFSGSLSKFKEQESPETWIWVQRVHTKGGGFQVKQ